jgi:acyl carrier protein
MAGVEARVVDGGLSAVPAGVPGELVIGGIGLARGYLGQPARTAEKLVPDPLAAAPGARLYRTGDLGRWRPDGRLEFLGRRDQQVKIRGQRIELGEIEAALASHPAVREAALLTVEEGPAGRWLAAFVVPHDPRAPAPDERELRDHLRPRLPAAMIPAAILALPALPLTVNGKLDRADLAGRVAALAHARPAAGYLAPRNPVEEVVTGIWAELLGLEKVGAEDDFFALGGHSLLATQVLARVTAIFQVELPLRRLFETPTPAALATEIAAREAKPGQSERIAKVLLKVKARAAVAAPAV